MIRNACETESLGDQISETVLSAADDLYHLRIPRVWCQMSGASAPPLTWGLGSWLNELQLRCHHFEKILILGREKMPAYWLGAFFNPRGLLALMKQDYIKQYSGDRSGNFEQFVFQTEVTSRDKDHVSEFHLRTSNIWLNNSTKVIALLFIYFDIVSITVESYILHWLIILLINWYLTLFK